MTVDRVSHASGSRNVWPAHELAASRLRLMEAIGIDDELVREASELPDPVSGSEFRKAMQIFGVHFYRLKPSLSLLKPLYLKARAFPLNT
jgi:hypothetical protein